MEDKTCIPYCVICIGILQVRESIEKLDSDQVGYIFLLPRAWFLTFTPHSTTTPSPLCNAYVIFH